MDGFRFKNVFGIKTKKKKKKKKKNVFGMHLEARANGIAPSSKEVCNPQGASSTRRVERRCSLQIPLPQPQKRKRRKYLV